MTISIEVVEPRLFSATVADEIIATIQDVCSIQSCCHLALAGGSTPGSIYRLLATSPRDGKIPWEKLKVFVGDERWVPHDDPGSNFYMMNQTLLNQVAPGKVKAFPFDTSLATPDDGAKAYAEVLKNEMPEKNGFPVLDLVLLGLGEDGHFASIFPGTGTVNDRESVTLATVNSNDSSQRVSLSLGTIMNAERIIFLVKGEKKKAIMKKVVQGTDSIEELPALALNEVKHKITWFVDSAAAAGLPPEYR